jgi:hypothetical protein
MLHFQGRKRARCIIARIDLTIPDAIVFNKIRRVPHVNTKVPGTAFLSASGGASCLAKASRYLLHRPDSRWRKRSTFRFKMLNNFLYHLAQISINLEGIVTVDTCNEVWAFSKVDLILFAPLHPLVIFITRLHFRTSSTAR